MDKTKFVRGLNEEEYENWLYHHRDISQAEYVRRKIQEELEYIKNGDYKKPGRFLGPQNQ